MAGAALRALLPRGKQLIVCFGEVLWDVFEAGEQLGGAPANVAHHATQLGAHAALLSRVGADARGRAALRCLATMGVDVSGVQIDAHNKTGAVRVQLSMGQPSYTIESPAAWDAISAIDEAELLRQAAVFYHGTLCRRAQDTRRALGRLLHRLNQLPPGERPLRVVDLNLRFPHCSRSTVAEALHSADIVKLNRQELDWLELNLGSKRGISHLLDRYYARWVLLTDGARGAELWGHSVYARVPGRRAQGGDTVGAGDAFVAAFLVALQNNLHPHEAIEFSNDYAAWVAGQTGAMPLPNAQMPRLRAPLSELRRAPHQ